MIHAFSRRGKFRAFFGNKFLDAMVKEVEDENKLAKFGCAGGPYDRSWSTGNNRWNDSRVFRSSDHGHSSSGNRYHPFSGQGPRYHQQPRGQRSRYVHSVSPVFYLSGIDPAVGARLLSFSEIWSSFTADSWVLDVFSRGYLIEFDAVPVQ